MDKINNIFVLGSAVFVAVGLLIMLPYLMQILVDLSTKGKKADSLSDKDVAFLKDNYRKYKIIENWCFLIPMIIGFIFLFNYDLVFSTYKLPHYILTNDYTGYKLFFISIFSISYWGYVLLKVVSSLVFGKHNGWLVFNFGFKEKVDKKETYEDMAVRLLVELPPGKLYITPTDEIVEIKSKLFTNSKILSIVLIFIFILIM